MESSLLETLLEPWWKVPAYIVTAALATIVVKISIKFDLNKFMDQRREDRFLKEGRKAVKQCRHGWTLYPDSPYSTCNGCLAWIPTPVLLTARQVRDSELIIMAERHGVVLNAKGGPKGPIVVRNYVGRRG